MSDTGDWAETTWEGLRLRQQRDYAALPFREKVRRLEEMAEVSAFFVERRRARGAAPAATPPMKPD